MYDTVCQPMYLIA